MIGGTELENCLDQNVFVFEVAFRLTVVQKNRQNGERRMKMAIDRKKRRTVIECKKTNEYERESLLISVQSLNCK